MTHRYEVGNKSMKYEKTIAADREVIKSPENKVIFKTVPETVGMATPQINEIRS